MRKLATFAAAFCCGIFLAQYAIPYEWLLPCAATAFMLACGRFLLHGNAGRRVLLIGLGLSLAFGYNWLFIRQIQRPMEALAGTECAVVMTMTEYAAATDYGAKVTVTVEGLSGKAIYYGDEKLLELRPGQTMSGTVRFQSAAHIRDDDITNFTSRGVFLLAYQQGDAVFGSGSEHSIRWWPARVGAAMREKIQTLFHANTAGFMTAILTGDKSELPENISAELSEAGLYHVLAVSGMHCGFLLTLVILAVGYHRKRLIAAVMTVLLVFYAALTGGSPSVVRACVMLGFLVAAPLFKRDSDGPTALLTALFLILLNNPFAAESVSLQLSFAAVAGILIITSGMYTLLVGTEKHSRLYYFTASGFSTTMGALLYTIPLSACYFGTVALVSPLSNLLCLWAVSISFIAGLAVVAVGFLLPPLGALLALIPEIFTQYVLAVAHILTRIPYHVVYTSNPYIKYWIGFTYLLFGAAYLLKPKTNRRYLAAVLAAALTLTAVIRTGAQRYQSALDAMVLDVGQGQCILLASQGEFALLDCGSQNSWYDAGSIAVSQLTTMGCRELEWLILTHCDRDHISGMIKLMTLMDVNTLLLPQDADDPEMQKTLLEVAELHETEVCFVDSEWEISLGAAELTLFPPVGEGDDNDRGLSLLASVADNDLLVTGDMGSATEKKLLESTTLPDVEYLVAGHHGSKYATSDELLDALTPEYVFISTGSNSYGHPSEEVLRRLALRECMVYRTDLHGTIHFSMN